MTLQSTARKQAIRADFQNLLTHFFNNLDTFQKIIYRRIIKQIKFRSHHKNYCTKVPKNLGLKGELGIGRKVKFC